MHSFFEPEECSECRDIVSSPRNWLQLGMSLSFQRPWYRLYKDRREEWGRRRCRSSISRPSLCLLGKERPCPWLGRLPLAFVGYRFHFCWQPYISSRSRINHWVSAQGIVMVQYEESSWLSRTVWEVWSLIANSKHQNDWFMRVFCLITNLADKTACPSHKVQCNTEVQAIVLQKCRKRDPSRDSKSEVFAVKQYHE